MVVSRGDACVPHAHGSLELHTGEISKHKLCQKRGHPGSEKNVARSGVSYGDGLQETSVPLECSCETLLGVTIFVSID